MGAPSEFGGLQSLGHEALDRPGVHERPARLGVSGTLRVALGDVDSLDAQRLCQGCPGLAALGFVAGDAKIRLKVEQRLLHKPGDHARIGAAAGNGRRAAGFVAAGSQHGFAQGVVGAGLGALRLVEIEAEPRLHDRIDVKRTDFAAIFHDVEGRGVDRQVHAEPLPRPRRQQRPEQMLVVVPRDRLVDEVHPVPFQQFAVGIDGVDHRELRPVVGEVPFDQRQHASPDGAEAYDDDRSVDTPVNGMGHSVILLIRR